jgi:DUF2934 family protein
MITGDFLSMSLTTDNVRPSPTPNAWRIGSLTRAGVTMGICLLSFCTGVLAVGKFGMNLGTEALRTLAFLVLVFGGQATIYAIRERRHLWGCRPSLVLAVSSMSDIAIASTLAISGIAMAPLPILLVAGTLAAALMFAFVMDLLKIPVFARLGIAHSPHERPITHVTEDAATTEKRLNHGPDAGQDRARDAKPEAIVTSDPVGAAERGLEVKGKPPADLTSRIAKRAYEFYEQGGRRDGGALENWQMAEADVRKDLANAGPNGWSLTPPCSTTGPGASAETGNRRRSKP